MPPSVEPNPPPGSASGDIADALGSTSYLDPLYNLERDLNIHKGRIHMMQGQSTVDAMWLVWIQNPGQGTAEAALSSLAPFSAS
ncbi:hypothetical protein F5Y16DRAFT_400719 [Xylariaceae sp. FL0255]|nr:hypothetical protein F5Y16DRAFT_400719 [Xylariaceae sp. FL0255]